MRRMDAQQAGFSLVEVAVAVGVLVIGVTAVTAAFTGGHRAAQEAARRQQAVWLAQEKLAEKLGRGYDVLTVPANPAERVARGVLVGEDQIRGLTRRWVVEQDQPAPGLARIWVAVSWGRGGSVQSYRLASLLAHGLTP